MRNLWLEIKDNEDRGSNFGRDWNDELEKRYQDQGWGIHRVEVTAAKLGSYLWATDGWRFFDINSSWPTNPPPPDVKPISVSLRRRQPGTYGTRDRKC